MPRRTTWQGMASHDMAWHDTTWLGATIHDIARYDTVWHDTWHDMTPLLTHFRRCLPSCVVLMTWCSLSPLWCSLLFLLRVLCGLGDLGVVLYIVLLFYCSTAVPTLVKWSAPPSPETKKRLGMNRTTEHDYMTTKSALTLSNRVVSYCLEKGGRFCSNILNVLTSKQDYLVSHLEASRHPLRAASTVCCKPYVRKFPQGCTQCH